MKKTTFVLIALVAVVLVIGGSTVQAQTTPITQWGFYGSNNGGWSFTKSTTAGTATVSGDTLKSTYAILRGAFSTVTPTTSSALVITGKLEFTGNIDSWSALRYGIFYSDSAGTLNETDVAKTYWPGNVNFNSGYLFVPYSGTNDPISWNAGNPSGNGSHGGLVNRPCNSTNNQALNYVLGEVTPKPMRAKLLAGTYNYAISIQPLANGTQELRFSLIKSDNSYWFGGISIDTTATRKTTKFNSVTFAMNNGNGNVNARAMKVIDMNVGLGSPITVPEAPWQAYYIDKWGFYAGNNGGWKFTPGDVIGNATVSGDTLKSTYAILRGAFVETHTPTTAKALKITGKLEFIGNIDSWSALRYGFFYSDSAGKLDTTGGGVPVTRWNGNVNYNSGYLFVPYSGTNDPINWNAGNPSGNGTHGGLVNRPSNSTNNQAQNYVMGEVFPKPARAKLLAGTYDFAISVQPLSNGTQELRFYLKKPDNSYWFGGTFIDTTVTRKTTKFNSVTFALNNGNGNVNVRAMKVIDMQVDMGAPIVVPEAPWQAYYIDQWGFLGGRMYGWKFTPGDVVGNATISGTAPNGKWSAVRGGFFEAITPTVQKALVVTGKMELVGGGFQAVSSLRFGVFYSTRAGKVVATPVDSTRWDGFETHHSGYLFIPPSGTNGLANWTGLSQTGSSGAVVNGAWLHNDYPGDAPANYTTNYVLGQHVQSPANAVGGAGVYDFAISVAAKADGSSDMRYSLTKSDKSYSLTGKVIDTHKPLATSMFNCVAFALGNNATTTGMKLVDIKVDLVDAASVPIAIAPSDGGEAEEAVEVVAPREFGLLQNYPNPFNPSTTISYDVAKAAHVTIRIYDVLGRVVAQLVDGVQAPSRYAIQWNPAGLSSGTYIYRIDAQNQDGTGTFTSVKKLLYMK
ncbi:MAG: T9SS type A sorting domain-containing protein [Ignavibacteria bacterium]|nr:T9SS type A sorting domain-containing protein [Ignavibacteria bacterium]